MYGSAPLAGLKVVELARILAGPWIGQTLADLGSEVIKVEASEPFVQSRRCQLSGLAGLPQPPCQPQAAI